MGILFSQSVTQSLNQSQFLSSTRTLYHSFLTLRITVATMVKPTTCCGRSDGCVCAQKATCSCGKQSAMHCTCDKKATENTLQGARCSCRARPAGQCTCDRASTENITPTGNTCACGQRSAGSCTCEKAADGGLYPDEVDFTSKA